MNLSDLDTYLDNHKDVSWKFEDEHYFFSLDGYDDALKVTQKALDEITSEKLDQIIRVGRNIDHVTRITGYFAKVSGWNSGKRAELKDRFRTTI